MELTGTPWTLFIVVDHQQHISYNLLIYRYIYIPIEIFALVSSTPAGRPVILPPPY